MFGGLDCKDRESKLNLLKRTNDDRVCVGRQHGLRCEVILWASTMMILWRAGAVSILKATFQPSSTLFDLVVRTLGQSPSVDDFQSQVLCNVRADTRHFSRNIPSILLLAPLRSQRRADSVASESSRTISDTLIFPRLVLDIVHGHEPGPFLRHIIPNLSQHYFRLFLNVFTDSSRSLFPFSSSG